MHLRVSLLAAALVVIGGAMCLGGGPEADPPRFIAIGGGIRDDNVQLYRELLAGHPAGRIVIAPYSSADAEGAAARMIERLRKHREGGTYAVMPDVATDPSAMPAAAEMLGKADVVFFTGGDQSRLIPRFIEGGAGNAALRALRESVARGATVGGTSAGCAALSDPMFTGGGSESALADLPATDGEEPQPEQRGVRLGRGLGLVDHVILDSHFLSRGRVGRMVAALEKSGKRFGVGVADNRGVRIEGDTHTAIGDAAALVVDARELKREGLSRRGVRISLLSDGDTFVAEGQTEAQQSATGTGRFSQKGTRADRLPEAAHLAGELPEIPEAWGKNAMVGMLGRLAADPTRLQIARSERFEVVIAADDRTRFAWRAGEPSSLSVLEARMDIVERGADASPSRPATR
jgi:cyanophycinase